MENKQINSQFSLLIAEFLLRWVRLYAGEQLTQAVAMQVPQSV